MAVSVLVHAAVIAFAWHATPPRKPSKEVTRLSVRLVARAPQPAAAAPRPTPAVAPVVARHRDAQHPARAAKAARSAPTAKAAAQRVTTTATPSKPPTVEAPAVPAETVDGSVFALPHIGIGGTASRRWMKSHDPSAMPPPSFVPPQAMHAHAAREAGRTQIVLALQRQVSAWQAPGDAGEGTCSLHAQAEAQLDCDSAALQQVVGAQASSLSGLLAAYRSIDPSASSLSIAYQQGRYHVSLASTPPAQ